MLKRNTAYNKGAVEYTQDGIRLKCGVAGTTGSTDLIVPAPPPSSIVDGAVTWQLVDYAGVNYSLDEKKIGTWIDGKPLYQKTIVTITPSTEGANTELFSLPENVNPSNVLNMDVVVHTISGFASFPTYYYPDSELVVCWIRSNGKVTCCVKNHNWLNADMYITLQYIKGE